MRYNDPTLMWDIVLTVLSHIRLIWLIWLIIVAGSFSLSLRGQSHYARNDWSLRTRSLFYLTINSYHFRSVLIDVPQLPACPHARSSSGGKCKVILVHATKAYRGSRCVIPLVLNLDARRRLMFNATLRPLYSRESNLVSIEREQLIT